MNYKLSFYNETIEYNKEKYIWNTLSGALIKLNALGEQYISSFSGSNDSSEYFQILSKNRFIVLEEIDEIGTLLSNEQRDMFNSNPQTLVFTIAPGMDCNYHCVYCFENRRSREQHMTKETESNTVSYIIKKAEQIPTLKKLDIKWFGGEPLIYLDTIRNISQQLSNYCQNHDIEYDSGLITNGSLLTEDVLETVLQCHISSAQITIDGLEAEYCKSKGTTSELFYQTIDNICKACRKLRITIRLNIPGNDADKAIRITDYLLSTNKLYKKIDIYFAFVRDYNKDSAVLDYRHFCKEYEKWLSHMLSNYNWRETHKNAPKTKSTSCGLIHLHNSCIGPTGELYKCEHCIGNIDASCGDIINGNYHNINERAYMETLSSGKRMDCINCKYLPLCMGGCANDYVTKNPGFNCEDYKQHQKRLKMMYSGILLRE